jgi:hypothetical protein
MPLGIDDLLYLLIGCPGEETTMLIVKGIAVGTVLWFFGIVVYLGFSLFYAQVETNHATGLSAVKGATLWNPAF